MAPRKNYTPGQIEKAIDAVKNGEKVTVAAQRFGVPRITLHDKITGKTPISCTMGPSTVLTKLEEESLERWLLTLSKKHIPFTKDSLLDSVQKIITNQNRPNPFTNNRPSKKWFQSFMKRHPNLSQIIPGNLSRTKDNISEDYIRNWFNEIETYLDEHDLKTILNYPHRLFNTDESAFFLSPKPDRVIAKKGDKHPYRSGGVDKDKLTVLITGNAAGDLAPPMIIFNYERIPSSIAASVPDEWAIGKSESGWMCSSTFYEYISNVFNPWLQQNNIEKPILLFVDGLKSHLTLHLSNFCSQNGIEIFALYPNSTHIIQPMDLSVFRPLKAHWKKALTRWEMENLTRNLRKENFAPVLQKALTNITKDCIKNGFRAGGLFPFGLNYIEISKLRQTEEKEIKTNPAQAEFVKYLEKEIVQVFSSQKLHQFNKLYLENRSTLESNIPNEDVALYLIWAKNKSECACHSISLDATLTSDTFEKTRYLSNNVTTAQTNDVLTKESSHHNQTISSGASLAVLTETENSVRAENSAKGVNFNDFIDSVLSTQKESVYTGISGNRSLRIAEKVTFGDQKLSDFRSQQPMVSTMVLQPPKKKSMESVLGVIVPSPFKRSLFWPENLDSNRKKMKREKIPSTVTIKAWKEYHDKKEAEKNKKQQDKEERAMQRIENKKLKEQLANEKKNKTYKTKIVTTKLKRKKTIQEELTSEDSDAESGTLSERAENDISYDMPVYLDVDFEMFPLSKFASHKATKPKKGKKFSIGSFVIIKYEGEYFPGKVESVRKNDFEISTMTLSTGNSFKWPNLPDKMFYGHMEIIEEIKEPICLNKRGFYRIPEMDKYLPHVYNL